MSGFQKGSPRYRLGEAGFASQLLLVLLLLGGVAAGTYLVQNGTNFLPKATAPGDYDWPFPCRYGDWQTGNLIDTKKKYGSQCASSFEQEVLFSHCDKANGGREINRIDCTSLDTSYCKWSKPCPPPAAPAVQTPATARKTPYCDTRTTINYGNFTDFCSKGCIGEDGEATCDESGTPTGTTATVKDCTNPIHIAFCKAEAAKPANANLVTDKCILVDGAAAENTKCVYKSDTCTQADITGFGSKGCKIITRNSNIGQIKYSVSADNQAVAAAPAAPATGGAPAGGAAAPAVNKAGAPTTTTSNTAAAGGTATSAECGYTYNGTTIPCYRIGVFDDKTRAQIEANAKIASENYVLYEKVLSEIGAQMDAAAKAKAEAALAAAKGALACTSSTSTPATTNATSNSTANRTTNSTPNSTANSSTNSTTSSANNEPACTNPTGCCRTFRPGPRKSGDSCASPKGYVYKTEASTITTDSGTKKQVCSIVGDPIPEDDRSGGTLCRTRPW